jgi:ABC-type sugar transport system permease subunit
MTAPPPTGTGPLARREARLAWGLLLPTLISRRAGRVLPLLAIFWISFKPIGLADLRPPAPVVREAPARRRRRDADRIPAAQLEPGSGDSRMSC